MTNLRVNSDFVFEEIYLQNWNILHKYYMCTYFFTLATELTNLNLKTNQTWDPYLNFDIFN